jgi:hypothetical protein
VSCRERGRSGGKGERYRDMVRRISEGVLGSVDPGGY